MVTQLKEQTATTPVHLPAHKLDGKHRKSNGANANHGAQVDDDDDSSNSSDARQAAFKAHAGAALKEQDTASAEAKHSALVARGKDLVSGETASIATAAAVVVGAALIEVELIPGILIGAGAILLGKMFPEMGVYVRPMIKGVVRAGFSMGQKAREAMAEASEQVHDLVAEVKHEQAQPAVVKKSHSTGKGTGDKPVH